MSVKMLLGLTATACLTALAVPAAAAASTSRSAPQRLEFTVVVRGETAPPVSGAATDHFISFNRPVAIPGVGLAAGTYLFRFITPSIVQVTSPDRAIVYGMFLTTPIERTDDESESRPEMTFEHERTGAPVRIAGWFLRDAREGVAPVYPKG